MDLDQLGRLRNPLSEGNARATELECLDHSADALEAAVVPLLCPLCDLAATSVFSSRTGVARDGGDDEEGGPFEEDDFGRAGEVEELVQVDAKGGKGGHEVRHDDRPCLRERASVPEQ